MRSVDLGYVREDLTYTFRTLSLFFRNPITISTPKETFTIGDGPGGFSATLFQRGFECQLCGACCFGSHARGRCWVPGEDAPDIAESVDCSVNGVLFPIRVYMSENDTTKQGCDFLIPLEPEQIHPIRGTRLSVCSLWREDGGQVPANCRLGPGMQPNKVNTTRGQRTLLSRRLPSRNWKAPQCPVPVYTTPLDEFRVKSDRILFHSWMRALENIPGHFLREAYGLWGQIISDIEKYQTTLQSNVYFEDYSFSR